VSQAATWPRYFDNLSQTMPAEVLYAVYEEALARLTKMGSSRLGLQQAGLNSISFSGVSESYQKGAGTRILSQDAREFLSPYLL
jgi:hypothetical protein